MPRLINQNPKYRKHACGQAVVRLNGHDVYLGPYGTKASRDEYDRVVGEWLANGRQLHGVLECGDLAVMELIARYWAHAQQYYRKQDGTPTSEVAVVRPCLKPLK